MTATRMAMENLNSGNQILQIVTLSCGEDYSSENLSLSDKLKL